jgi:hypothetical protein
MISIDYIAGSHGNYLEFVLNKLVNGDKIEQDNPFDSIGASHNKTSAYHKYKVFKEGHFFEDGGTKTTQVISIQFTANDLLPLMTVSLRRAGNLDIDDDQLHVDTYNKLNNDFYLAVLSQINNSYAKSLEHPITADYPDCPRHILREFFKFGFLDPSLNGFMRKQQQMVYTNNQDVFKFPYRAFYDITQFMKQIDLIQSWADLDFYDINLPALHRQFILRQPHSEYQLVCDNLVACVLGGIDSIIPELTLFQESYINANLEFAIDKEMPFNQPEYFKTTQEIIDYLNEI